MVTAREGRSLLGCLVGILIFVTAAYFGLNFAEPYWRYYRLEDAMSQAANFAGAISDAEIIQRLRLKADSLGLPPEAQSLLRVTRTQSAITITTQYEEVIELPGYVRHVVFRPRAEARF
jgi:hypothetical protein